MIDRRALLAASLAATPAVACARTPWMREDAAIRALVDTMQAAWNSGDFRGYMEGFANPDVVFVSGGRIQDGWQATLDHYVRDYGGAPERRGSLRFYDIAIDRIAPDAAMLIGHYRLDRPEKPQEGVNTRLFRKRPEGWRITMNHVSSFTPT